MSSKKKKKRTFLSAATVAGLPLWLGGFFVVAIFLTSIFGQNGFIDLKKLTREKERLLATNERLDAENRELHRQINRLKHDRAYIEALARRELGVVGKDELVIHWRPVKRTP